MILSTPAHPRSASHYDDELLLLSHKKRRISLASSLEHSVDGIHSANLERSQDIETDRFIPTASDSPLPMKTTPRTRRFAQCIGASRGQMLSFSEEPAGSATAKQQEVPTHGAPASPDKQRAFSIMRHCSKSLLNTSEIEPSASAQNNFKTTAETVLSAPELFDDFYSHPVDWSISDWVALATSRSLNIRNMHTYQVTVLWKTPESTLSAVRYHPKNASKLAAGYENGDVELWDCEKKLITNSIAGDNFVGGLSWRPFGDLLSAAFENGAIKHYDQRVGAIPVKTIKAHAKRVTGICWNEQGTLLASGSADSTVRCWELRADKELPLDENGKSPLKFKPIWKKQKHISTVKALSWCPWQPHLLATGGGTQDGTIRLFSTKTSSLITMVPTHSQVSSLHWSAHTTELVSTHGYAWDPNDHNRSLRRHSILVHSLDTNTYTLKEIVKINDQAHGRISDSCMNLNHTRLLTAGADESVRIWKIFGEKRGKKRAFSVFKDLQNFR